MESIKAYLLSVTAAALICGLLNGLTNNKGSIHKIIKLLCGIFLAASVIRPVVDMRIDDVYWFTENLTVSSELAVTHGEKIAADDMKRIIKEKTEAYILDKAKALGTEIAVDVTLQDCIPERVTIVGNVSPFVKSSLSESITQDLNIPAEEQIWKRS